VANSLLKNRKPIHEMFKLQDSEGFYEVLINRHLKNNDIKFRKFFLINYQQFDFLLSLIKNQLIFGLIYCTLRLQRFLLLVEDQNFP